VPSPPLASAVVVSNQGGTIQTGTVMAPGPPTYVPYAWTEYDRWLNIVIRDARLFREAKKDQVVWYGEVLSSGTSRDLRRIINYLLVAAFAELGRDTKQGVIHELKEDDEQAASLMRE
jgi:phenylacetate-coenzyme A ligase PaaK-like adenylate-forming protein